MPRSAFATACLALAICSFTALTGCNSGMNDGGQDVDLVAEKPSKEAVVVKGTGPLWPLTPGRSWRTLTMRPDQQNTDSLIRVAGTFRLPDGRSGTIVESSRNNKVYRIEIYHKDASGGVQLLGLGESIKKILVFTPAIPVLEPTVREGNNLMWQGTARLDGKSFNATALHRISAVDTIKTPLGESIPAYRLDGIISLINGSQRIDYPAVEWLVPGKGIAQRRLADRGTVAIEIITRFSN